MKATRGLQSPSLDGCSAGCEAARSLFRSQRIGDAKGDKTPSRGYWRVVQRRSIGYKRWTNVLSRQHNARHPSSDSDDGKYL